MARDKLYIEVTFDGGVSDSNKERFVELVAEEMEFGNLRNGQFHKTGWGMPSVKERTAHVVQIKRHKPPSTSHPGRNTNLEVEFGSVDGVWFPEDRVRGRFMLRGKVVKGLKSVLGRRIEGRLTHAHAEMLRDDLTNMLDRYPNTGTTPEG